jgi:hypothetical protein
MVWGEEQENVFKEIKRALTNTIALSLPDLMKPFFLYVHERLGTAVGFLTQLLGFWHCPEAYLSMQHDALSQGWPHCPCALAPTVVLVAEADKLTLGHELTVQVPHSILTLMEYIGNYWLTNS